MPIPPATTKPRDICAQCCFSFKWKAKAQIAMVIAIVVRNSSSGRWFDPSPKTAPELSTNRKSSKFQGTAMIPLWGGIGFKFGSWSKDSLFNIDKKVEDAVSEGGKVVFGGKISKEFKSGYFYEPTVLLTDNSSKIAREELFGPVLTCIIFEKEHEAINLANDNKYGFFGQRKV